MDRRSEPRLIAYEILKEGRRVVSLLYLEDETPHTLTGSFEHFFLSRRCLFKHTQQVLDIEPVIQKRLAHYDFRDGERALRHFRFADSQAEPGVQASDPIGGLLGKLFSYAARTQSRQLVADRRSLKPAQRRTLAKLGALLDRSVEVTPAMSQRVMSIESTSRAAFVLEGA